MRREDGERWLHLTLRDALDIATDVGESLNKPQLQGRPLWAVEGAKVIADARALLAALATKTAVRLGGLSLSHWDAHIRGENIRLHNDERVLTPFVERVSLRL